MFTTFSQSAGLARHVQKSVLISATYQDYISPEDFNLLDTLNMHLLVYTQKIVKQTLNTI
jgi:hypothetical protein